MFRRPFLLLLLGLWPISPALAENAEQVHLTYAPVVRRAAPAVVNIFSRQPGTSNSVLKESPAYRASVEAEEEDAARTPLGSGVIVDPNGTVVTNEHVIHDAGPLTVVLSDRRLFDAVVTRTDERTDLAVLKIDAGKEPLPSLEIGQSDALEVGDVVLAIGNPFGVGQTVTSGIVSALARTVTSANDERTFIQTDAAINPGNSGGPLVSLDGKLVGINTALYSETGGSIGIGFAIPTELVRAILAPLGSEQRPARPWLGVRGRPVTVRLARRLGLPRVSGVLITEAVPSGAASAAGLAAGDVVLTVDGKPVDDDEALRFRIATLPVGATARIEAWRDGRMRDVAVRLTPPPEQPSRDVTRLSAGLLAGVTVANLSPALAEELRTGELSGIIVLDVPRSSAAAKAKLRVGDIITSLNSQPVATVAELERLLQHSDPGAKLALRREGRPVQIAGLP